jgi:hypothetical protein
VPTRLPRKPAEPVIRIVSVLDIPDTEPRQCHGEDAVLGGADGPGVGQGAITRFPVKDVPDDRLQPMRVCLLHIH